MGGSRVIEEEEFHDRLRDIATHLALTPDQLVQAVVVAHSADEGARAGMEACVQELRDSLKA